jgi:hypothetical protein
MGIKKLRKNESNLGIKKQNPNWRTKNCLKYERRLGQIRAYVVSDIEQNEYRRLRLAPKDIVILEYI